jgi:AraC-like DNA-binding protein
MAEISEIKYDGLSSRKLHIPDLREFLRTDKSNSHFIKGALVCFCTSGCCTVKINYSSHKMKENDVLVILPTHIFSIEDATDNLKIESLIYTEDYWTSVSQSINYRILKKTEGHPLISLQADKQQEIYFLLNTIKKHEAKAENNNIEQSIIGGLAYSLLMIIGANIDAVDTELPRIVSRKEELTRGFFDLLSEHFEKERQVAFYASKLCVTPKHLSLCVKEITKLSILDWVNNVTILSIKRRLRTTNDTIQQISEDMNFQTASTFIRFFRQHTGTTPLKFRNSD